MFSRTLNGWRMIGVSPGIGRSFSTRSSLTSLDPNYMVIFVRLRLPNYWQSGNHSSKHRNHTHHGQPRGFFSTSDMLSSPKISITKPLDYSLLVRKGNMRHSDIGDDLNFQNLTNPTTTTLLFEWNLYRSLSQSINNPKTPPDFQ